MSTPPMSFGRAIVTVFRKYADFNGRAGLAEFWWFFLFTTLVSTALGTIGSTASPEAGTVGGTLASIWSIGTLLPTLAVAVRRLRDGGNRWTQLFWLLLPIAGIIVLVLRLCDPPTDLLRNEPSPA